MKIIADENIPFGKEAFGTLGEVVTLPGRAITANALKQTKADVLLVRSITKVNSALLEGSCVRFVGTATIGTDHVDLDFLKKKNIGFSSAPGSNANSVAEYVTAALLFLAKANNFRLRDKTLGVIGAGNVGARVAAKARVLDMKVLLNDPPLARAGNDPKYLPLERLFDADILTLHVPLNKEGQDATYHMVNEDFIRKMKPDSILINTSRGSVVDETALKFVLRHKRIAAAVLDVWEHEPGIDTGLLKLTALGTPHIAGYSFDGKVNGASMIYRALCEHLKVKPQWSPDEVLSPKNQVSFPADDIGAIENTGGTDKKTESVINKLVKQLYNIEEDDQRLRKITELTKAEQGPYFDRLRKDYPARREFQSVKVKVSKVNKKLSNIIQSLGFNIIV